MNLNTITYNLCTHIQYQNTFLYYKGGAVQSANQGPVFILFYSHLVTVYNCDFHLT